MREGNENGNFTANGRWNILRFLLRRKEGGFAQA